MFLMATLTDGRQVVSEFIEVTKILKYATEVFKGQKLFNAWRIVSHTHPASGEAVLIRTREVIPGHHIVSLQQVEPKPDLTIAHDYEPARFQPVKLVKEGDYGLWRVPANTTVEVDGVLATPDVDYPVHRDPRSLRDYVILRARTDEDVEVRYYTDGRQAPARPATEESFVGAVDDDDDLDEDNEE